MANQALQAGSDFVRPEEISPRACRAPERVFTATTLRPPGTREERTWEQLARGARKKDAPSLLAAIHCMTSQVKNMTASPAPA